MSLNVNSNVTDVFYRYKMPRLIAKVEGKGNGIKTVVVNITEIAKALSRPPSYACKFFGFELGAQTLMDHKADRYIVNGAHEASKLQALVDVFIRKFVLCASCENPETVLNVREKKGLITQTCKACGHKCLLDMRHKLTAYILKNPPETNNSSSCTKKAQQKSRRVTKTSSGEKGSDEGEAEEDGNLLRGWSTDADDQQKSSVNSAPTNCSLSETGSHNDETADEWSMDVSDEAVKQRQCHLADSVKGLTIDDDLSKSEKERMDIFYHFIVQRCNANTLCGASNEKAIVAEADRLEIRDKASLILCELLFNDNILAQIVKYRTLFLRLVHENKRAQRHLLSGIDQVFGAYRQQLMLAPAGSRVVHVLKRLYDCDLLDESVIIEWSRKQRPTPSNTNGALSNGQTKRSAQRQMISDEIRSQAAPFIKWLQDADEETDSDDSSGDLEISYDDRVREVRVHKQEAEDRAGKQTTPGTDTVVGNTKCTEQESVDDDLDIDNI